MDKLLVKNKRNSSLKLDGDLQRRVEEQMGRMAEGPSEILAALLTTGEEQRLENDRLRDEVRQLRELVDGGPSPNQTTEVARAIREADSVAEPIDERLRFERLLSELSTRFLNLPAAEVDGQIEQGLQRLAEFLQVDQAALFELAGDKRLLQLTHSWIAPGCSPPPHQLRFDDFPWATGKMHRGEMLLFSRPCDLPLEARKERAYLSRGGPRSALAIPLAVAGTTLGSVVFSALHAERTWTAELIQRTRLVGEIFANALQRKKADESQQWMLDKIRQLQQQLKAENVYLREEIKTQYNFDQLIGQSGALQQALHKAGQVAPTDATVLLLGETGTGKELLARAIHNLSSRRERPLVKVNCAALPANLIESELFGREKGAFTGAQARQVGRFELADKGTIFLDEIGDLPSELQTKLLRVLQDGEFERLGSPRTLRVDVRIIAATNRDLKEEMSAGRFREDLYYRLQVFPITMPPLRERKKDIPLLVQWFVEKYARKMGKTIDTVPKTAMEALQNAPWPGNVRELENVIERAVINTPAACLCLMDSLSSPSPVMGATERKKLNEVEADYIRQTLEHCLWRIEGRHGAAAVLGLNPSTLRGRMQKLGIRRPRKPQCG